MSAIAVLIDPRVHDLGDGFEVRRAVPHAHARSIGPFVFFDHMGPVDFAAARGVDVRPHPHIGLATLTYLFDGALTHRDTTGVVQVIRPGDVNWMVAGSGIAHSERSPEPERAAGHRLHGIQTWLALPVAMEETAPAFYHHPAATLPEFRAPGVRAHVIAGTAFGLSAPMPLGVPTLYVALQLEAGASIELPAEHEERAVYLVEGECEIDGTAPAAGQLAVLVPGVPVRIVARTACRAMLVGGAKLDAPRHIWWNFVSTSRERIERAKQDWREMRYGQVPGEHEFIPLPG